MLYINGGSTISYQPKKDSSNNVDTILTLPTNDVDTKMAYASTRYPNINFTPASPQYTYPAGAMQGKDARYPTTLTPGGTWGVAGAYTLPTHPGWFVVREGVLLINDNYNFSMMTLDTLNRGVSSSANPGLYSGCYMLFNAYGAWSPGSLNTFASWCMNGGGSLVGTAHDLAGEGWHPRSSPGAIPSGSFRLTSADSGIYPVQYASDYQVTTGTVNAVGSINITPPYDCHYALEYIWIPLSASVGGEQSWYGYTWYDLYNAGYRFDNGGGSTSTGWTYGAVLASNGYANIVSAPSGYRNGMYWRLLVQPIVNDGRHNVSYARVKASASRTNTDGSKFTAQFNSGNWSSDIGGGVSSYRPGLVQNN